MKATVFFFTLFAQTLHHIEGSVDNWRPKRTAKEMAVLINALNMTWKAAENDYFNGRSTEEVKRLMGVQRLSSNYPIEQRDLLLPVKIPTNFDARKRWPRCMSIGKIRDQSNCGSCWAIAAAEAISDRICIATKGRMIATISTVDLLSCCTQCGSGCQGGYPYLAWVYWVKQGLVTGGQYGSQQGCKPYPFPPCNHHVKGPYKNCTGDSYDTPKCVPQCDKKKKLSIDLNRKYYGRSAYKISTKEAAIQRELMLNGPLEASIAVYEDFLVYKSGIYEHVEGDLHGYHAVKLLGWGQENGIPYWLMANSWNEGWGEKGYFRLKRGENVVFQNECVAGEF